MTAHWTRRTGWMLASIHLIACAGTPVTEPPSVAPPELPDVRANESVPALEPGVADTRIPIGLYGGPGAVKGDALVWAINLDADAPPVVRLADADGSFNVALQGNVGDRLRMHTLVGDVASAPLDMTLGTELALASPARSECLAMVPDSLDLGTVQMDQVAEADLTIENTCNDSVDVAVRLHSSATDFELDAALPFSLAPGESETLSVVFSPSAGTPRLRSSVLFLNATGADREEQVVVTLWGRTL
jgi:Abnormal spindle-like microcephaly-assoc'd, ASPM-SPD-2-Hydin